MWRAWTATRASSPQLIAVALLNLVMAITVAGVAFMIYPVLRRVADARVRQGLALRYVGTRVMEGGAFLVGILATLAFVPLSRDFAAAGAPGGSYFETIGSMLQSTTDHAYALGQPVFAIGAAMLYCLLLRSKLVPVRAMALQEMVLALWLIIKGFNSAAPAATPDLAEVH